MISLLRSGQARAGNALVLALIISGAVMAMILTSTTGAVSNLQKAALFQDELRVQAAVEAVLARRQYEVIKAATLGRPADLITWGSAPNEVWDHPNYGVDTVNGVEVRWKVEPAYTYDASAVGFVQNPTPGDGSTSLTNEVVNNGDFYLYRVAAEGRILSADGSRYLARAQGAKYVITPNESTLLYLIYYAQRGPKGDLELNHGPALNLQGGIYSGGSVYLGSGTQVNDWTALKPSNGATVIGPPNPCTWPDWVNGTNYQVGDLVQHGADPVYTKRKFQCTAGHVAASGNIPGQTTAWTSYWQEVTRVPVTGLDGIYRLSKHTLYGAINGFPMSSVAPGGFSAAGAYQLGASSNGGFAGETGGDPSFTAPADGASVQTATRDGTLINPARIRDWSGGSLATTVASGSDNQRVIVGVPLRGVPEGSAAATVANDSRDNDNNAFQWRTGSLGVAAPGFNGTAKTFDNGGEKTELAATFQERPEEAQAVRYLDLDGDETTDEHEYAMPLFRGGTDSYDASTGIEQPGHYLSKALGANAYMKRRADMTGWDIVDGSGNALTTTPAGVGLVVRERPRPAISTYTPAATPTEAGLPSYMPYAYGKWNRPRYSPFTQADVSASLGMVTHVQGGGINGNNPRYSHTVDNNANHNMCIDPSVSLGAYVEGGQWFMRAANSMGPNTWDNRPATYWSNAGYPNAQGDGHRRYPHLFRENWRFAHLSRAVPDSSRNGFLLYVWPDKIIASSADSRPGMGTYPNGPMSGSCLTFHVVHPGYGYTTEAAFWSAGGTIELAPFNADGVRSSQRYLFSSGNGNTGYLRLTINSATRRLTGITLLSPPWSGAFTAVPEVRIVGGGATTNARAVASLDQTGLPVNAGAPHFVAANASGAVTMSGIPNAYPLSPLTTYAHLNRGDWSIRAESLLVPDATRAGSRVFSVYCRAGNFVRLWVNDTLVVEAWPATVTGYQDQIRLAYQTVPVLVAADRPNTVVFEYAHSTTGTTTAERTYAAIDIRSRPSTASDATANVAFLPGHWQPPAVHADGRPRHVFRKSSFTAVQARISSLQSTPASQKVGLMVRNAAGAPNLLDGRDPYAALLMSPSRGFFSQYRGLRARQETRSQVTAFIGNGTRTAVQRSGAATVIWADAAGQVGDNGWTTDAAAPIVRSAGVRMTGSAVNSGVITQTENVNTVSSSQPVTPATLASPFTVSEGTANAVVVGPLTRTITKQVVRQKKNAARVTHYLELAAGRDPLAPGAVFKSTDSDTTTNDLTILQPLDPAGIDSSGLATALVPSGSIYGLSYIDPTHLAFTTGADVLSAEAAGTPRTATQTWGTATTFWDPLPWIYSGITPVRQLTAAQTKAALEARFGGTYVYGGQLPSTWPEVTFTSGDYPAWPADPSAASATPKLTNGVVYSFSLRRYANSAAKGNGSTGLMPIFDINPYIGTWGAWAGRVAAPSTHTTGTIAADAARIIPTWTETSGWVRPTLPILAAHWRPTWNPSQWYAGDVPQSSGVAAPAWLPYARPASAGYPDPPAFLGSTADSWFFASANPFPRLSDPQYASFAPLLTSLNPLFAAPGTTAQVAAVTSGTYGMITGSGDISRFSGDLRHYGDQPVTWNSGTLPDHIWLRLEKDDTTFVETLPASDPLAPSANIPRTVLRLKYYTGSAAPASSADFVPLVNADGSNKVLDITGFGPDLLVGPCLQSGDPAMPASALFSDLQVEFNDDSATSVAPGNVLDYRDWENAVAGSISDVSRYLCSQYQVFFGNQEITEDFFTVHETAGTDFPRQNAREDWFINPREFWSQSRWWDRPTSEDATVREKDPGYAFPTASTPTNREHLAKTTLLTFDLRAVQDYLKNRRLVDAVSRPITGGTPPAISGTSVLADLTPPIPNGLVFFAARTNRYPWNPLVGSGGGTAKRNPFENPTLPTGVNPLPNSISGSYTNATLAALGSTARATAFAGLRDTLRGANHADLYEDRALVPNSLQPYPVTSPAASPAQGTLSHTPALKPQEFIHGIRLTNGATIDWDIPATGVTPYGTSKTTIVTPNALYLHGNLNTQSHSFTFQGVTVSKVTPLAVFGDSITMLSGAWSDTPMQQGGLVLTGADPAGQVLSGGAVTVGQAASTPMPRATATRYNTAIFTHNLPTTKRSVAMGEASSLINTMLFLEDWTGKDLNYLGSLVVMDSRRYTRAYQLDSDKLYGITPLGWMVDPGLGTTTANAWKSVWTGLDYGLPATTTAANGWSGRVKPVYGAPNRIFAFNYDYYTREGTPPEIPYGVKAQGFGGWVRLIK